MTRKSISKLRPTARRSSVVILLIIFLSSLAWIILDRVTDKEGGTVELITAGRNSASIEELQSHTPEQVKDPKNVEPDSARTDAEYDSADTQAQLLPQSNLDLKSIVREFILERWGGETIQADSDYVPKTYAKLESDDPQTKRRGQFELQVRGELGIKFAHDPYYPLLFTSMTDNWSLCLNEYGLPSLEDLAQLTQEQQDALLEKRGLVGEKLKELASKCWQKARIYSGKDDETDRLLELQHQYYLIAAQAWVKANPDSVVPLPE